MRHHFTSVPLIASLVITGTSACSKKDVPTPAPASDTCSYALDGMATKGTVKWTSFGAVGANNVTEDALSLQMTSATTAGLPAQTVIVSFIRPIGAPVSAYQPVSVFVLNGPMANGRLYTSNLRCTVVATVGNGYSGTFAATSNAGASYPITSAVTNGVFTDAHQ